MTILVQRIEVAIKHKANIAYKHNILPYQETRLKIFLLIVRACCLSLSRKIMTILSDHH